MLKPVLLAGRPVIANSARGVRLTVRTTNPIAALFGKSPFGPIQEHMRIVTKCAQEIVPLFEALQHGDHDRIQEQIVTIFQLEGEADAVKNDLRSHLPRSLFIPVDRRDLLDLLSAQDSIADGAQDVAGLLSVREMTVPDFLSDGLIPYVVRVIDAVTKCEEVICGLDELLELGFRGTEIEKVEENIRLLSEIESETDRQGMKLVGLLFDHETELTALHVVYWQKLIGLVGDIADYAENVGDRLRLLIAH